MQALEAFAALTAMGLELSAMHDKLAVRPRDRITDVVRELIRHHRDGLLDLVRGGDASLPCPAVLAERAAIIGEASRSDAAAADVIALREVGFDTFESLAARHRQAILRDLNALRPSGASGARLDATTRRFVSSPHFLRAVTEGWDMLELFGVSPGGPLVRLDGMGVAVMLALSRHSSRITGLDRSGAVFVTKTGANHTFQRFRYDLADLVPWWHCPALASPRSAAH